MEELEEKNADMQTRCKVLQGKATEALDDKERLLEEESRERAQVRVWVQGLGFGSREQGQVRFMSLNLSPKP